MSRLLLITGGTGSLGQALTLRAIQDDTYEKICIYSRDEHKQEAMQRSFKDDRLRFFIGDIRDKDRLTTAMQDITDVIHAAALKVVPLLEYNPSEAVRTNVIGAMNVIEAAYKTGVSTVLGISTDKAVMPVNLYGATKLCAEKLFLAANHMYGENGPRFAVARYGNVVGSNGSVVPLFRKLKKAKKPITVTDPEMTRYWITLEDAAEFVYTKLNDTYGGEIFTPTMPSFKVMDLARIYSKDIEIIGVRPGEKIHESINVGETSDTNTWWLSKADLKKKLKELDML